MTKPLVFAGSAHLGKCRLQAEKLIAQRVGQQLSNTMRGRISQLPILVNIEIARIYVPVLLEYKHRAASGTENAKLRVPVQIGAQHIIEEADGCTRLPFVIPIIECLAQEVTVLFGRDFIDTWHADLLGAERHAGNELDISKALLLVKAHQLLHLADISFMHNRKNIEIDIMVAQISNPLHHAIEAACSSGIHSSGIMNRLRAVQADTN
ncbi:hypothetical protein D3C77_456880 [compost metagenome]